MKAMTMIRTLVIWQTINFLLVTYFFANATFAQTTTNASTQPQKHVAATLVYRTDPVHQRFVLPMEHLKEGLVPCVRLILQDGKPYLFYFDFASPVCLLDQQVAEQTHLPLVPATSNTGEVGSGLRSTIRLAEAPDAPNPIDFPIVQLPFILNDFARIRATNPDLAGALGTSVFAKGAWTLDFGKHEIMFTIPGNIKNTPQEPQQVKRLPLKLKKGLLVVEGLIDDKPTQFVLSSYLTTTLQASKTIAALEPVGRLQNTAVPSGTPKIESRVRLQSIKVGECVWSQPLVIQSLLKATNQADDPPNLLGLDFLSRFRVTLDLPSQSWYLEPNPAYKAVSDNVVGLGFSPRVNADENLEIVTLDLPSPASEAGLKVGDVITAVNGLVCKTTPIQQIVEQVQHKPEGTVITLVVLSKGEDKPRELTLKIRKLL